MPIVRLGLKQVDNTQANEEDFDLYRPRPRKVTLYNTLYDLFISNLLLFKDLSHRLSEMDKRHSIKFLGSRSSLSRSTFWGLI